MMGGRALDSLAAVELLGNAANGEALAGPKLLSGAAAVWVNEGGVGLANDENGETLAGLSSTNRLSSCTGFCTAL